MEKLNRQQKKELIAELYELYIQCGYSLIEHVGTPLNKYDYEKVQKRINQLKKDYDYINSTESENI
jgi:hypothetical protein